MAGVNDAGLLGGAISLVWDFVRRRMIVTGTGARYARDQEDDRFD